MREHVIVCMRKHVYKQHVYIECTCMLEYVQACPLSHKKLQKSNRNNNNNTHTQSEEIKAKEAEAKSNPHLSFPARRWTPAGQAPALHADGSQCEGHAGAF